MRVKSENFAIAAAIVLVGGLAAVYFVRAISHLNDRAHLNAELSFSDREIAGGNSIIVNQEAAYEARALIPTSESYKVLTGDGLRNASSLTYVFVDGWFRYFLMPRRPSSQARWIVCYGCDTSKLEGAYSVRWHDGNGISIGRLR